VRLRARSAATLAELYGVQGEAHAVELAHHFADAPAISSPEKLVHYSLLAGGRALVAFAWEEARSHFQRGVAAKGVPLEGTASARDGEAAALLFGLGRAQSATAERHQRRDAVTTMCRAFDYYAEAAQVEQAVAVAEYPMYASSGQDTGRTQLLSRALELVPTDSHAEGRLLSRYGLELGCVEGDYEGAQVAFSRALLIAQREGDTVLEARTVAYSANVNFFHLRLQDCLRNSLRAIELGRLADDLYSQVSGRRDAAQVSIQLGELRAAKEHAVSLLTLAEQLGDRVFLDLALRTNESMWRFEGFFQTARDFSDRGLAVSPRSSPLLMTRALLEYEEGDFAQGEVYTEMLIGALGLTPTSQGIESAAVAMLIPWSARITGVMSRFQEAEAAAQTVLSSPTASPIFVEFSRIGLALLAVVRGDGPAAQEQYSALENTPPMGGPLSMTADHILALLSHTMGNLDQAIVHFENSLAFCRKAGYRPELAWTCCDYADTLLQRKESGDRTKAMFLLDESLAISSELGMRPLMERVLSRREILRA